MSIFRIDEPGNAQPTDYSETRSAFGGGGFKVEGMNPNDVGETQIVNGQAQRVNNSTDAGTYHLRDMKHPIDPSTSPVLSTARNSMGMPVAGARVTERSVVTVGGLEMEARTAANLGYLIENGDGTYSDPYAAPRPSAPAPRPQQAPRQAPQQAAPQEAAPSMGEGLEGEAEDMLYDIVQKSDSSLMRQAVFEMSEEGISPHLMNRIAEQTGLDPERASEMAGSIQAAFELQAEKAVESYGLDAEEVFDWARRNQPQRLKDAMQQQGFKRSTEGYKGIARDYLSNLDRIDPQAILNADFGPGITARMEGSAKYGKQRVVISTPKGDYEWRSALRAGLINVSRPGR